MKRDPFWLPPQASELARIKYWKMLGKFATGKKSTVMVGVKY
jgi:hypothetical protein